jgi:hypothetical protein
MGLGHSSVQDLRPGDLVVPPGFVRNLGVPSQALTTSSIAR